MLEQYFQGLTIDVAKVTGDGYFHLLWMGALVYCGFFGTREKKWKLVYPILIILSIVIFPVSWWILNKFLTGGTYSRVAWCFMGLCFLAITATDVVERSENRRWRLTIGTVLLCVILFCGKWMYTQERFSIADNVYKLSEDTIAVADYLKRHYPNETVVIDNELSIELRQYDATIKAINGRDYPNRIDAYYNRTQEELHVFLEQIREQRCFVCVSRDIEGFEEKMMQESWYPVEKIQRYIVYIYTQ